MRKDKTKHGHSFFGNFLTIRVKLMVSFLVLIGMTVFLGVASYQKSANAIRKNYTESACQTLNMTGEYLAFGFRAVENTAAQLVSDENVKGYFSGMYGSDKIQISSARQTITKLLASKSVTEEFIENIYLISEKIDSLSTRKIKSSGLYHGFIDTPMGKKLQQNKMDVIWSGEDSYLDEKLDTKSTKYSLRLIRNITSINGIIVIDIGSDIMKSTLSNIEMDQSGILGIVTADSKEILLKDSDKAVFSDQTFYKEALASGELSGSKYVNYEGHKYLFMYAKIGRSGAMICSLVSQRTILKQAADMRQFSVIIIVIVCFVALFTAVMITNGMNKAIKGIIKLLKKASTGDLTAQFHSKRRDEFKMLMDEIQNTLSNMKGLIYGVKTLSNAVLDSSVKVGEATGTFQRSTENISFAMNEVEQGVMQQANDAEGCLSEMDNLSKKIILISDNTKEISRITEQTKDSIQNGTKATNKLNDQTKSTIEITTNIIKKVEHQAEKSLSIGKVTNVISEIANQINLLSFNASIESARAGEWGRGFAVIADEIRSLAEQSKQSVDDIQKMIQNIQEESRETMRIVHQAEAVIRQQEHAVMETTLSYQTISSNVAQLVVNVDDITSTIETIEGSRVSTLEAIENISAVLEEVAASSNTVTHASKEQVISVEGLGKLSEDLSDNANQLLFEVQKFIVS